MPVTAITLFVDDLAAAQEFYGRAFALPVPEASGARMQFTISVPDVDAAVAEFTSRGVELLNGPMDRPRGIRTAAFADPAGHIWELAGDPVG